jgi:hypothetical protein
VREAARSHRACAPPDPPRASALLRSQLDTALDVSADGVYAFGGQRCDRVVSAVMARIRTGEVPRTLDS